MFLQNYADHFPVVAGLPAVAGCAVGCLSPVVACHLPVVLSSAVIENGPADSVADFVDVD